MIGWIVCMALVSRSPDGDAFARGWAALERGETDRALAAFEERRADDAGPPAALRVLRAIDALKAPCPAADLAPILAATRPARFARVESPHVVLLHQGDEAEAVGRLEVLERVVMTFGLWTAGIGLELPPPGRKLVSIYFAEGRDYAEFLTRVEAGGFATTQGFNHPGLHAVFAFDTRSRPANRAAARAVVNLGKERGSEEKREQIRRRLDREWRTLDLGIAAHETVHQLSDACALAPRFDDFPTWLHEGLAAQFEVVRDGRWAGVGRVHDIRLPDWRAIRPAPALAPLLRDSGFGRGYDREAYAQAWALVYFLRKTRPAEFLAYLDLLRAPGLDATRPEQRSVEAFRRAFGDDLAGLEREWRRYLAGLDAGPTFLSPVSAVPTENRLAGPTPGP